MADTLARVDDGVNDAYTEAGGGEIADNLLRPEILSVLSLVNLHDNTPDAQQVGGRSVKEDIVFASLAIDLEEIDSALGQELEDGREVYTLHFLRAASTPHQRVGARIVARKVKAL